jgi:hypothetical protein
MLSPPATARRPVTVVGGAAIAADVQLKIPANAMTRLNDLNTRFPMRLPFTINSLLDQLELQVHTDKPLTRA